MDNYKTCWRCGMSYSDSSGSHSCRGLTVIGRGYSDFSWNAKTDKMERTFKWPNKDKASGHSTSTVGTPSMDETKVIKKAYQGFHVRGIPSMDDETKRGYIGCTIFALIVLIYVGIHLFALFQWLFWG